MLMDDYLKSNGYDRWKTDTPEELEESCDEELEMTGSSLKEELEEYFEKFNLNHDFFGKNYNEIAWFDVEYDTDTLKIMAMYSYSSKDLNGEPSNEFDYKVEIKGHNLNVNVFSVPS